ncbi:MAG: cytochrome c [Acidiferrobacterales bacterium]
MKNASLLALAAVLGLTGAQSVGAADNTRVSIKMPPVITKFKPGPGMSETQMYCTICHTPAYVYMQAPLSRDVWKAEVTKMQKAFGCPIPDAKIDTVVNYLVQQNGTK